MSCHVKIATKVTKKATPSLIHLFSLCSVDSRTKCNREEELGEKFER